MKCLWLVSITLGSALADGGVRTYRSREALVKTSLGPDVAREYLERLDYYCSLFEEFFQGIGLKKKNDNKVVCRLMLYDEFETLWRRNHEGEPPAAFFSASMNAIALFHDPGQPWLRQTLFHEASHQFFNRFTYDEPKWLNEGLAEYFEGWWIEPGQDAEVRPALFDLIVLQESLRSGRALDLEELVNMEPAVFSNFPDGYPGLHRYLHYSTSWGLVYYCLEGPSGEDRELLVRYLKDLNDLGPRARFAFPDPEQFARRFKEWILSLDVQRRDLFDYRLVGDAFRENGEYRKAVQEYEQALEKYPEATGISYALGFCYRRIGDTEKAREFLTKACEEEPADAEAHYQLARIVLGVDRSGVPPDPARALELARTCVDLTGGESARYLFFLGECQAQAGDPKEAVRTWKKVLRLLEDDEEQTKYVRSRIDEVSGK